MQNNHRLIINLKFNFNWIVFYYCTMTVFLFISQMCVQEVQVFCVLIYNKIYFRRHVCYNLKL